MAGSLLMLHGHDQGWRPPVSSENFGDYTFNSLLGNSHDSVCYYQRWDGGLRAFRLNIVPEPQILHGFIACDCPSHTLGS